jgi:molybdopterin converting factor small subunit
MDINRSAAPLEYFRIIKKILLIGLNNKNQPNCQGSRSRFPDWATGPRGPNRFVPDVYKPRHHDRQSARRRRSKPVHFAEGLVARISFTANLERHLSCPTAEAGGRTVRKVLDGVFSDNPRLRSYLLDEHGRLRRHVNIFVAGEMIADRETLADAVGPDDEIYVFQALSGG